MIVRILNSFGSLPFSPNVGEIRELEDADRPSKNVCRSCDSYGAVLNARDKPDHIDNNGYFRPNYWDNNDLPT